LPYTFVWTGRAVQAGCDDLEMIVSRICMDRPCGASRMWRSGDDCLAHLYSARWRERFAPWPSWISARIRSHSRQGPERPQVHQDHRCDGETVSPSLQSNSQTSAGIFRSSSPLTSALHF